MSKTKKKEDSAAKKADREEELELEQEIDENQAPVSEESSEDLSENEAKVEDSVDWQDKYLRLAAEYENFRRRSKLELEQIYKDASCAIVLELLPVLDSFDSALSMEDESETQSNQPDTVGIRLIYKQLKSALENIGVEEIEALGKEFDPLLHQAVMSVEDEDAGENEIVEVFQKGYSNGGRVIRHSMVKVAN